MTEIKDLISAGRRIRRNVSGWQESIRNNEKLFQTLVEEFSTITMGIIIFEKPEFEPFLLADYKGDHSPDCTTMGEAIGHSLARISYRSFNAECKSMGDVFTSNFIQTDWLKLYGQGKDFCYYQTAVSEIGTIFTQKCLPEDSKIDISLSKIGGLYSLDFTWELGFVAIS